MEERIVERLRKVLALTNSPVEGEAQAAAAMLAKLLADHNLSIADLEKKGAAAPGVKKREHDLGKAAFKWKLDLAEAIAEHYYCHSLVNRDTKTVAFVGRPDNVESLQMLYGWIIDQIKRIASDERRVHQQESGEHIDPLRWQVNFGIGAVNRLSMRLIEKREEERRKQEAEAPETSTALVIMGDERKREISDYLEKEFGYRIDGQMTARRRKQEEEWAAYMAERRKEDEAKRELLEDDPEGYYRLYPHEHPDAIAKRQKEYEKECERDRKREERNARRRTGPAWRPESDDRRTQRRQAETATDSGYRSADKVNLNPFLTGEAERKKIG